MAHPSSSVARTQVLPVTIAPTTHVDALCVLELRELRWIGPVGAAVSTHGPMNVQRNLAGTHDNEPTTPVRHSPPPPTGKRLSRSPSTALDTGHALALVGCGEDVASLALHQRHEVPAAVVV